MECILTRRSIRQFTADEVPEEVLRDLLEAARWAPSWSNSQTWEIVVVKDQDTKQKLAEAAGVNRATHALLGAPTVLVFCARQGVSGTKESKYTTVKGDWSMFDCALACQNFCLAAHNRGVGTVLMGNFQHHQVDAILGLPEGVISMVMIPLGYPAAPTKATPRKVLSDFVHFNKFGTSYVTD